MKITNTSIFNQVRSIWGDKFIHLLIGDVAYWAPRYDEVQEMVGKNFVEKYKYAAEVFDCDDFALILHAFVRQEMYRQRKEVGKMESNFYPWAFGEIWGHKFMNHEGGHAVNICITKDRGLILIEPQGDRVWSPTKETDEAFYIRM